MINVGVLTISDKGSQGLREDLSGEVLREGVARIQGRTIEYEIVPDEKDIIAAKLIAWADSGRVDVILTTGGTGLSARDVTPEATLSIIDREIPGIAEAMRAESLKKTPMAMLSRAVAGQRAKCIIINMPGSPKACRECMEIVSQVIPHAIDIMYGIVTEHVVTP
jgi:molybdenum cofactor synthesis domain-containing protein